MALPAVSASAAASAPAPASAAASAAASTAPVKTHIDLSPLFKSLTIPPVEIEECPLSVTSFREYLEESLSATPPRRFYVILLHDIMSTAQVVEAGEGGRHFAINGFVNATNGIAIKHLHLFEARSLAPFSHKASVEFTERMTPQQKRRLFHENVSYYLQANLLEYSEEVGKTAREARLAREAMVHVSSEVRTPQEEEDFLHYMALSLVDAPGSAALVTKVQHYIEQGKSESVKRLQKVQEKLCFDPAICVLLGTLLHHPVGTLVQDMAGSEQHFRKALELRSDHIQALIGLGTLLVSLKRFQEARSPLERLLQLKERRAPVYAALATVSEQAAQLGDARHHLQRATKLDPANEVIRFQYGGFLFRQKEYEAARKELRLCNHQSSSLSADVRASVKQMLDSIAAVFRREAEGLTRQAIEKREQGRTKEALGYINQALQKDPDYDAAQREHAQLTEGGFCAIM